MTASREGALISPPDSSRNVEPSRDGGPIHTTTSSSENSAGGTADHGNSEGPQKGKRKAPRRWTAEEDAKLKALMANQSSGGSWNSIANAVRTRTSKQVRERWKNKLNPNLDKGPITEEEASLIEEGFAKYPNRWATIREEFLPRRSDNDIKNYYNTNILRPRQRQEGSRQSRSVDHSECGQQDGREDHTIVLEQSRMMDHLGNGPQDGCQDPDIALERPSSQTSVTKSILNISLHIPEQPQQSTVPESSITHGRTIAASGSASPSVCPTNFDSPDRSWLRNLYSTGKKRPEMSRPKNPPPSDS